MKLTLRGDRSRDGPGASTVLWSLLSGISWTTNKSFLEGEFVEKNWRRVQDEPLKREPRPISRPGVKLRLRRGLVLTRLEARTGEFCPW